MIRSLSMVMAVGLLAGCTSSKEVLVEKTTTHYVVLDDSWLKKAEVLPPPTVDPAYESASLKDRIDMWSKFYLKYTMSVTNKNLDLDAARKYNALKKQESYVTVCKEGVCKQQ